MGEDLRKLAEEASALIQQEKWDEAIALLTEPISQETDLDKKSTLYEIRGVVYFESRRYNQAVSDFNEAIRLNPENSHVYYNRGNAYSSKGQYDEAIADYNEAIRLDPENNQVYNNRGNAYLAKGDFDKAIDDYSKAIENGFSDVFVYTNRGTAHLLKDQYDEAIADYNEAERLGDRSVAVYCNRGNAYLKKYEYSRAISDYDEAIKLNPRYAEAYNGLGNVYGEMGKYDDAFANYEKAEKYDSNYVDTYNNRAVIYNIQGEYDKAIDSYNKLIEKQPSALAYHNLALTHYNKGNDKDAFKNYDKALEQDSNHAMTYNARGLLHHQCCVKAYSKGRYKEATRHSQKAREDFKEAGKSKGGMSFEAQCIDNLIRKMESPDSHKREPFNSEEKKKLYNLYIRVSEIRNALFLGALPPQVRHYCPLDTLKNLAQGAQSSAGKFRLYNADYMDDPEEGEALLDILSDDGFDVKEIFYENKEKHRPISQANAKEVFHENEEEHRPISPANAKEAFYENEEEHEPISPAYVGSFTRKKKEELFLWRAYGKQNGVDAAGACLAFGSFAFSTRISPLLSTPQFLAKISSERDSSKPPLFGNVEKEEKLKTLTGELVGALKPPLFKVVYKGDVEKEEEKLKTPIAKLAEALKGLEKVKETHGLVRELLDEIRFLFKSDHYKEEEEARVIIVMPPSDREHKDRVKIDCDEFPPKFYVELFKGETVKEISLGPQVKGGISEWKEVVKRSESLKYAKWLGKSKIKYGAK